MAGETIREALRLARVLERQLIARRRLRRQLAQLDAEVKSTRKLLADLSNPFDPSRAIEATIDGACCLPRAESANAPHDPLCPRMQ